MALIRKCELLLCLEWKTVYRKDKVISSHFFIIRKLYELLSLRIDFNKKQVLKFS